MPQSRQTPLRPAETILLETILSETILSETILVRPFGPDTGLAYGRKPQTGLVTPIAGSETSRMVQMGRIGAQKLRSKATESLILKQNQAGDKGAVSARPGGEKHSGGP